MTPPSTGETADTTSRATSATGPAAKRAYRGQQHGDRRGSAVVMRPTRAVAVVNIRCFSGKTGMPGLRSHRRRSVVLLDFAADIAALQASITSTRSLQS